jgi:hypothetical protein
MGNVGNPINLLEMNEVQVAARALGLEVAALEIRRGEDIAPAIEALKGRAEPLWVAADPLLNTNRVRINALAQGARLPTIYVAREYVEAGGLMSYGASFPDLYRRAADYADRILRGQNPSDIPVEQPTRFDFQPDDSEGGWPRNPPDAARPRRRGDRIAAKHGASHLLHCLSPKVKGGLLNAPSDSAHERC